MALIDRMLASVGLARLPRGALPVAAPTQAAATIQGLFVTAANRRHPARDSYVYPRFTPLGAPLVDHQAVYKPVPINLRAFTRTTHCRRAINTIKDPIRKLAWEIRPSKQGKPGSDWKTRAETATFCLQHPNDVDGWGTFVEQLVEDFLVGAASYEQQLSTDPKRPVWMWPVDGMTVQIYPLWTGAEKDVPHYLQVPGWGAAVGNVIGGVQFLDDELVYIRPNPSTGDPFGVGPVQIAFDTIGKYLGVNEYSGKLATNSNPNNGLWLKNLTTQQRDEIRDYWQNEIEGRGEMPLFGGEEAPEILAFKNGDQSLYLKYMDWLVREIATAFNISPQNMGLEQDVNRNTAEVGADRDWDGAIAPVATAIQDHINRKTLHQLLGWHDLEFVFPGLDRDDEKEVATIFGIEYRANAKTPNEYRESRGLQPLKSPWADMLWVDTQIAMKAAQGAKEVDDPGLPRTDPNGAASPTPQHNPQDNADTDTATGGDKAAQPNPDTVTGDQ